MKFWMLVFFGFISFSGPLLAESFDKKSHKRLVKIIKKKASKNSWELIEKLGPKSEASDVASYLIARALEDVESLDPRIFSSCWKVLKNYRSQEAHWAFVKKLKSLKKEEEAVLPLILLNQKVNFLSEDQKKEYVEVVSPYLRSSYWPCHLAAVKACRAFPDEKLGNILAQQLSVKGLRHRIEKEIKQVFKEVYKRTPKADASNESWVSWWLDELRRKKSKAPKSLVTFAASEEVGSYSGKPRPIEKIEYFNHKIDTDNFMLITDYSMSMGPAVTITPKIKTLRKSYLKDSLEKLALNRVTLNLSSKHEFVVLKQIELLSLMPSDKKFNLIYFGNGLSIFKPIKKMVTATVKNKKSAMDFLTRATLSKSTQLYEGISKGMENKDADTFFVLTDGKPVRSAVADTNIIERACLRWSVMRQIIFNTIDLGMIPDKFSSMSSAPGPGGAVGMSGQPNNSVSKLQAHDFMKRIAQKSGGKYKLYKDLQKISFWIPEGIKQ